MIHFLWQHNIQSSSKLTFSSYIFLQPRLTLSIGIFKVTLKMRWFFVTLFVKWPRLWLKRSLLKNQLLFFLVFSTMFSVFHHVFELFFSVFLVFSTMFFYGFSIFWVTFPSVFPWPRWQKPRPRLRAGTLGAPGAGQALMGKWMVSGFSMFPRNIEIRNMFTKHSWVRKPYFLVKEKILTPHDFSGFKVQFHIVWTELYFRKLFCRNF